MRCSNCEENKLELLKTAYGDYLCEDCWDDYICSDEGKLEYMIGICYGYLPIEEFDADFLGEVAKSWMTHYNELELTQQQITEVENKACALGLF